MNLNLKKGTSFRQKPAFHCGFSRNDRGKRHRASIQGIHGKLKAGDRRQKMATDWRSEVSKLL
jgi:hypothetical protein